MAYQPITAEEFDELEGLDDWRYLRREIHAQFRAGSFPAAGELVAAIARAAEEADHHPGVDLRYPDRVHVVLSTHVTKGVSSADVELARTVSELASRAGARAEPVAPQTLEIALDTTDVERIRPFWAAVLGYREDPDDPDQLDDPQGLGPALWFQQMDEPRRERNRFHLDVTVAPELAQARLDAALAAGGRLVTDRFAPAWWVLADPEGNEACICTSHGR